MNIIIKTQDKNISSNRYKKIQDLFYELDKNKIAYIMALPGILFLIAFCIIPLAFIVIAFKRYNLMDGFFFSPFVGFDNFSFFFSFEDKAWQTVFNTVLLNSIFIIVDVFLQVCFAIMLNEIRCKFFKKISQSIFFFPYFLSWVVIGSIIYGILSSDLGAINNLFSLIGLEPIKWYNHPEHWRAILVIAHIWKWTGYGIIIYLATIAGFDTSCFESAIVDGANKLQEIVHITIPMLKPTIIVLVLFSVGRIFFGDFGMVYGIVRDLGPLLSTTEVIDTYVFRSLRQTQDFSIPTAIGLFQSILGFITIFFANKFAKKINDGSGLF